MGLWPTGKQQNRGMLLKQRSLTQIFLLLWHSTHDNLYTPRLHLLHRAAPAPHPPPRRPPLRRSEGAQLCPAAARPSPVSPRCHRLVGVRPPSHSLWYTKVLRRIASFRKMGWSEPRRGDDPTKVLAHIEFLMP
ncbi:hypothetical protein PAHAL_7G024700 [Panicum hallii]|uniref:Uncharacterized protein n=1 Tax=Panicum hallii TaxID=206008 RepID=A0A2T8IAR1_9POAL|nr:hypothetical protein PAHAL_7G024700 [Panicum hallii]